MGLCESIVNMTESVYYKTLKTGRSTRLACATLQNNFAMLFQSAIQISDILRAFHLLGFPLLC